MVGSGSFQEHKYLIRYLKITVWGSISYFEMYTQYRERYFKGLGFATH